MFNVKLSLPTPLFTLSQHIDSCRGGTQAIHYLFSHHFPANHWHVVCIGRVFNQKIILIQRDFLYLEGITYRCIKNTQEKIKSMAYRWKCYNGRHSIRPWVTFSLKKSSTTIFVNLIIVFRNGKKNNKNKENYKDENEGQVYKSAVPVMAVSVRLTRLLEITHGLVGCVLGLMSTISRLFISPLMVCSGLHSIQATCSIVSKTQKNSKLETCWGQYLNAWYNKHNK